MREKTYVNGRVEGRVAEYGGRGKKIREFHIINGLRHGTMTQWNSAGEVIDSSEWDNGTGVHRIYDASGQLAWEQETSA